MPSIYSYAASFTLAWCVLQLGLPWGRFSVPPYWLHFLLTLKPRRFCLGWLQPPVPWRSELIVLFRELCHWYRQSFNKSICAWWESQQPRSFCSRSNETCSLTVQAADHTLVREFSKAHCRVSSMNSATTANIFLGDHLLRRASNLSGDYCFNSSVTCQDMVSLWFLLRQYWDVHLLHLQARSFIPVLDTLSVRERVPCIWSCLLVTSVIVYWTQEGLMYLSGIVQCLFWIVNICHQGWAKACWTVNKRPH